MKTTEKPAVKVHPVHEAMTALEAQLESETNGQLKHCAEGSFSNLDAFLKNVEMAGNYAKALLLVREAKALIPATFEDYFANVK